MQVVVNNNSYETDKLFDYKVPAHLSGKIGLGMRVMVPFGRSNKRLEAYVLNINKPSKKDIRLKTILAIIDERPILSKEQLRLVYWMKNKYLCKYIEAIHCLIPRGIIRRERKLIILVNNNWRKLLPGNRKKFVNILTSLEKLGGQVYLDLLTQHVDYKDINESIKILLEKNLIDIKYEFDSRVGIKTEKYALINIGEDQWEEAMASLKNARKQRLCLEILKEDTRSSVKEVLERANTSRGVLNSLQKKGYIKLVDLEVKRNPFKDSKFEKFPKLPPNREQKLAIDRISTSIDNKMGGTYLIHGITGSGKTEVYLQLIERVLEKGEKAIVLVPEIALTPQTVARFMGRFKGGIAVLHSSLSDGERYDEWRRIVEGKVHIVIGARSAIFAPLKNIGIIIIDEEHENTYKSEQAPRYNAIEVAAYRSRLENSVLVLGSATPSIESYYRALEGEIGLINLTKRAVRASLPTIEVVNMTKQLELGNRSIFSYQLIDGINENLRDKKQTILFLNRRGFSNVITCKACGYLEKCSHCDISLTYHKFDNVLKCHYCGQIRPLARICPVCQAKAVSYLGMGTQKVEDLVKSHFPTASVKRMDMDTTSQKGAHERILRNFKQGKIDILIGTQMISKGLDFPNVTLVGIILADSILNLPDFRAGERTFQLTTQVAGRSGRGLDKGRVILQTYEPNHYTIMAAKDHDYKKFIKNELAIRREFHYPPFTRLILLNFMGREEDRVRDTAETISRHIKYILDSQGYKNFDNIVLGPNPSIIGKIKDNYRYQLLLKDFNIPFALLKKSIKYLLLDNRRKYIPRNISFTIDIDPNTIL